jgi:hypothetical protein
MEEIDKKKAELEQTKMYLAQMLAHKIALMDAEGKEDARKAH